MNNIEILEQLATTVEQSGADLAPTYQEYMSLAFAIANSCGEEGRAPFHRLCRMSAKYKHDEADKLYGHALQKGTGKNSLGTVFHLAELAGVRLEKKLANLQNLQPSLPHAHTRVPNMGNASLSGITQPNTPTDAVDSAVANAHENLSVAISPAVSLPRFPAYRWPAFIQQIIARGDSPAQCDILLLGSITVLGSTIHRLVKFMYGRKNKYPCLQTFITAPAASGKGAVTWLRRLAEPIHDTLMDAYREKLKEYRLEKTKWEALGKQKGNVPEPEMPHMKMHLIAGDNTGTGILENLMDSDGVGLICETEADTISNAISGEYGHWSDILRKCFDHERLAYNRRTNHEYRECKKTFLCVLVSGTPAQIPSLIPSAEDGQFSRHIFYNMPAIEGWENQFGRPDMDYDSLFTSWGMRWKEVLDALMGNIGSITLQLNAQQQEEFNLHLARLFERAGAVHGDPMKSSVTRIAVNLCRIMSIIALLRSLESLLPGGDAEKQPLDNVMRTLLACPGLAPAPETPQENIKDGVISQFNLTIRTDDFHAVLALAEPLYRHACHVLSLLPSARQPAASGATAPETLFDCLPLHFSRTQALEEAKKWGMPVNSVDSMLKRMTERGQLVKAGRGEYEFTSRMRTHTHVCGCGEEPASSASLQVSPEQTFPE